MPVVEVELVGAQGASAGLAQLLADAIGAALGAPEGTTWVRLRVLDRSAYAESGGAVPETVRPVFVTIMERRKPARPALEDLVGAVTDAVAQTTGHPRENVHVIYTADAAGRAAFGGHLVE